MEITENNQTITFSIIADSSLAGKDGTNGVGKDGKDGDVTSNVQMYLMGTRGVTEGSTTFHTKDTFHTTNSGTEKFVSKFEHDGSKVDLKLRWTTDPYDYKVPTISNNTILSWSDVKYLGNNVFEGYAQILINTTTTPTETIIFSNGAKTYTVNREWKNPSTVGLITDFSIAAPTTLGTLRTAYKDGETLKLTFTVSNDLIDFYFPIDSDTETVYEPELDSAGQPKKDTSGNIIYTSTVAKHLVSAATQVSSTETTKTISFDVKLRVKRVGITTGKINLKIVARNEIKSERILVDQSTNFDNIIPTCTLVSTTYNNNLQALDLNHEAVLAFNGTDYNKVTYNSLSYLNFYDNPSATNPITTVRVKCVHAESYAYNTDNVTLTLLRDSNGATVDCKAKVNVASKVATGTFIPVSKSLRTDESLTVDYTIKLTVDQELSESNFDVPTGAGTLVKSTDSSGNVVYTMRIDQGTTKGAHQFLPTSVKNLAGKDVNFTDRTYRVQGFLLNRYVLPAFSNTIALNDIIVDPSLVVFNDINVNTQPWVYQPTPPANLETLSPEDAAVKRRFGVSSDKRSVIIYDRYYTPNNASGSVPFYIEEKVYGG